jgi:hypothetical protein
MTFDQFKNYNPYKNNMTAVNADIQSLLDIMASESPDTERYRQAQEVLNYAMAVRSGVTEKSNLFPVQMLIIIALIIFLIVWHTN